jgi:hypothetical protein
MRHSVRVAAKDTGLYLPHSLCVCVCVCVRVRVCHTHTHSVRVCCLTQRTHFARPRTAAG